MASSTGILLEFLGMLPYNEMTSSTTDFNKWPLSLFPMTNPLKLWDLLNDRSVLIPIQASLITRTSIKRWLNIGPPHPQVDQRLCNMFKVLISTLQSLISGARMPSLSQLDLISPTWGRGSAHVQSLHYHGQWNWWVFTTGLQRWYIKKGHRSSVLLSVPCITFILLFLSSMLYNKVILVSKL